MSVYVDDMQAGFGRMVMCHMIADSTEELLVMVDKIGVQRKWIQKEGTPSEHFDICRSKRAKALAAGAIEVSQRELFQKLVERGRQRRALPKPDAAATAPTSPPAEGRTRI